MARLAQDRSVAILQGFGVRVSQVCEYCPTAWALHSMQIKHLEPACRTLKPGTAHAPVRATRPLKRLGQENR